MQLINCKVELSLNWIENCVLTHNPNANNNVNKATFITTDAKVYVLIVTLSIEDNTKLSKLLGEGFKKSNYWNKYRVITNKMVNIAVNGREHHLRELLNSNYEGVKRLFVLAYNNAPGGDGQVFANSFKNMFFHELK